MCLSVEHGDKVLALGRARDYGRCRGMRKDGAPCEQYVNTTDAGYVSE